jgi:AbrB family looped-hinge helix DNA binding protein
METMRMPVVKMRPKGQITIPASIVEVAHLTENAQFDVEYVNGVILLKPINADMKKDDVLSYAGIFAGAWGETPDEVETTLRELHNEWER